MRWIGSEKAAEYSRGHNNPSYKNRGIVLTLAHTYN